MRVSRRKASASPVAAARKHQHTHLKTIRISNACSSIRIAPPDTVLVSHAAVDFAKLSERQPNLIIAPPACNVTLAFCGQVRDNHCSLLLPAPQHGSMQPVTVLKLVVAA